MTGFDHLDLANRTQDGRNVVLLEPLQFTSSTGAVYRAPTGTTSDGASTPPELWPVLPPFGQYWLAAVLHDAAYRGTLERENADGMWVPANLSKADSDNLLLEAMGCLGVEQAKKDAIYNGVRLFGLSSFREDRGPARAEGEEAHGFSATGQPPKS